LLVLWLGACQQQPASDSLAYEQFDDPQKARQVQEQVDPQEVPQIERKLIKEGNVEFETFSIDSTRKQVLQAVDHYKGYVASDQSNAYEGRISNTVIIRVPAENFDALLADITKGIEKVASKGIRVKDVTEEFVDISARLKTQKELEARYADLLQQATRVTEILDIEREMGKLRGEIESIEGRLRYLESQVALSTLTLTFYEETPTQTAFGRAFREGFRQGWENMIWFLVGLVNIWPFLLLVPVLIWGIRRLRRSRKSR